VVFTNSPVAGSYRGLGAPQGHFALECLVDEAAERLGMDPLEFRRRNHVRPEGQPGEPYVPGDRLLPAQPVEGGIPFSSNYLAECLNEGARRIGWKPRPRGARKISPRGKLRGMGVACCIYKTGQSTSSAIIKVKDDGTAELLMGTMEVGGGAWTILIQIAAETLGLRYTDVHGTFADTQTTPFTHGTYGSTTTFTSGLVAQRAAAEARRQILDLASRLLEAKPEELDIREGRVFVRATPDVHLPVGHVVRRHENRVVVGEAKIRAGSKTHIINSFAAHFAEVEVDPESGAIEVLHYVAVHDSGRAIHPEAARGQIVGGVVQGLGYALMEEIPLDPENGAPLALNLQDFKIPNVVDVPVIEPVLIERPDPLGPYGAKALGEPPIVPVAAAIANAVYDATEVRIRELPITAEKVLKGMTRLGRSGRAE
jgi:xanthine dehydrogenase molybdenum-binding subunit